VRVRVSPQDGSTPAIYTVSPKSNDPAITALTFNAGIALATTFASSTTVYNLGVPGGTTSVTITPTRNVAAGSVTQWQLNAGALTPFTAPTGVNVTITGLTVGSSTITLKS